jgi:AraC-like DNA-binding protein
MPMYNRWSTSHIAAHQRAEFWRSASQEARTPITPHIPQVDSFNATLTTRGLDNLVLNQVQVSTRHDVESTHHDLSRGDFPCVIVELYLSGQVQASQQGNDIIATPGEPFLIDGRRKYRLNHPNPVSMLALAVPCTALGVHAPAVDGLTARYLPHRASLQLLASHMHTLNAWPHDLEADEASRISDLLVGTFQAVLQGAAEESAGARKQRCFLRRRVQQIIEQQYADPALCPAAAADQMGISVRTLHARLAQDGTSFGAELMAHRLQRAHAMLRGGPQGTAATVIEISVRCGFSSPAHFSRRFRARYGVAPGAARRTD